jgi:hypothetical protein
MCNGENLGTFTDGVIDTLGHSIYEFQELRRNQNNDLPLNIEDPEQSVDGALMSSLIADGYDPG